MTATSCLVLYASTHGHTERIAVRVGEVLRAEGIDVRVVDVHKRAGLDVGAFDLVVVGASVHAGHHQPEIVDWLTRHAPTLSAVPVALFSVSLTAADDSDEAREATRGYVDELLERTGVWPREIATIAGALQYREYNLPTRVLIRLIARHKGLPTDPSVDVDYTDWGAVEDFARRAAALAIAGTATR
jgi:menaquinone-dependent protoporphyrinogen oxidase